MNVNDDSRLRLKKRFLDFAKQNVNMFSPNPNHTPQLLTNMNVSILTLGELQCSLTSVSALVFIHR